MSFTVWFTGLSGAGKTTLSRRIYEELLALGMAAEWLDGDVIRRNFSQGLGFGRQDRDVQVSRVGFVCSLLNKHGVAGVAALISPYAQAREENRRLIPTYVEVYVRCPLETLKRRDPKGLYARALAGEIGDFTGVSSPYEEPVAPEVVVDTDKSTVEECVAQVMAHLRGRGLLP